MSEPKPGSPAALRVWLAEQGIPECDCGYQWVYNRAEALHATGGKEDPGTYPCWVRTSIDKGCPWHGYAHYNDHTNDLGDWCPWSGERVEGNPADGGDVCPAGCRGSYIVWP